MRRYLSSVSLVLMMTTMGFAQDLAGVPSGSVKWANSPLAPNDVSAQRVVMSGSTTLLSQFHILVSSLAPGRTSANDQGHDELEELMLIKSGELEVTLGDDTKTLGPGSIVLILPGDAHQIKNAGDSVASFYLMRYHSKAEPDMARGKGAGGSFMVDFEDLEFEPHDRGGLHDYFDRATVMCSNFEMHATTLNGNIQSHPPHTHRAEEIILMVDGDAEEHIAGTNHLISTGDFAFLDSEIPHAIRNVSDATCTYFAFQWR